MALINEILDGAGFVENETYRYTQFVAPPDEPYVVVMDNSSTTGSDDAALKRTHDVMLELYEERPSMAPRMGLETALDEAADMLLDGWQSQATTRLEDEQLYQTIYEFSFIEKI